jgi:hypothetical protein
MIPALILFAASAASDADDAARIEQLIHHPIPATAAAQAKPNARAGKTAATDPAGALVGQRVHVRTVDQGIYAGTLQSIDANTVVLRIDLAHQPLDYSLPRHGVAELSPEVAP